MRNFDIIFPNIEQFIEEHNYALIQWQLFLLIVLNVSFFCAMWKKIISSISELRSNWRLILFFVVLKYSRVLQNYQIWASTVQLLLSSEIEPDCFFTRTENAILSKEPGGRGLTNMIWYYPDGGKQAPSMVGAHHFMIIWRFVPVIKQSSSQSEKIFLLSKSNDIWYFFYNYTEINQASSE